MAHIYICYSKTDAQFKDELVGALRAIYLDRHQFWHEQAADADGEVWPGVIEWVEQCDVFMYLLSNEAVASKQCRAEFREAIRLGKRILAVQVRDQTRPTGKVGDLQYVDMRNSLDDRQAFERFLQVFNKTIELLPKQKPDPVPSKTISQPQGHRAGTSIDLEPSDEKRKAGVPAEFEPSDEKRKASMPLTPRVWWKDPMLVGGVIGAVALLIVGLMLAGQPTATPVAIASTYEVTQAAQTLPPSATLVIVPLKTTTPDILQTAQKVIQQQTADAEAVTAAAERVLSQTQSAQETQAAALWTATLTPNITQTLNAIFTEWAQATATDQSRIATTTAEAWTATPSVTPPPTLTAPQPQTVVAPVMTLAPIVLTEASFLSPEVQIGFIPVAQNSDWVIVERYIDNASMLLVPVGCFTMGSSDGDVDEQPMTGQCFDRPFWIDKYEVTNQMFQMLGGESAVPSSRREPSYPRANVTWAEAQNFCIRRGARLPTEREWEYAARGPSNLVYPWGNDWNQDNIVWVGSHTAEIGSRPTGTSWVGSLDMAGNISEWVSSLYRPYPYQIQDGREGSGVPGVQESRIHRGQNVTFMGDSDFRSANRIEADVAYSADIGFRCVRSIG